MSSLFRSAPMKYYELFMPSDEAYHVVQKLSRHSFVEFTDANEQSLHRPYTNSIARCTFTMSKIDTILNTVKSKDIRLPEPPEISKVLEKEATLLSEKKITSLSLLEEIETEVERRFHITESLLRSIQVGENEIIDLEDYKYLLFRARQIFFMHREKDLEMDGSRPENLSLMGISGVIMEKDEPKFSRMMFRASKGNSILYTFHIPNNFSNHQPRTAFMMFLEAGTNLYNKASRICDSFGAKRYTIPSRKDEIFEKIKQIQNTINDSKQLLLMTEKKLEEDLENAVSVTDYGYCKLESYRVILEKEALIFHTLNKFQSQFGSVIAKIWIPIEKDGLLQTLLPSIVTKSSPHTKMKPPTHFETNSFTAPFQEIINTYGTPRYEEVNPALFAIAIFPFLFGVMFGDIGHGGALLCGAIWLVTSNAGKSLPLYEIRFLLLLMGIFAFYSGWIYNEFFSIPLNVFGSCYGNAGHEEEAERLYDDCVYPIGMDPRWIRTTNELNYFNSYKMKFAVIIGVLQMTFGILCKAMNAVHFKNWLELFFEWLPQQVFFFCTFGYMCILIIYKWTIPWEIERDTAEAPSIIAQMIALPLKVGSTEGKPLWDIESQETLQYNLLMLSLICVPWMLLIKPIIIWIRMPSAPKHYEPAHSKEGLSDQLIEHAPQKKEDHGDEHDDISEIAVHQIIETIEFVLGSISNTASYLRLWALSLAHGQLSKVFLEKTIGGGIVSANAFIIIIGMYLFFNITIGVIMCMDVMECFLHALRLQWVEFDSKFFKADGRKFEPLALEGPIKASLDKLRATE